MANSPVRQTMGPFTFPVVEPVLRGQLVEGRAGGVGVAAVGSFKVLGVALLSASNADPQAGAPVNTVIVGYNDVNTVVAKGVKAKVTYSGAATFGDNLVATALGKVAVAGVAPDARTVVGICMEPAGASAATDGYAFIF